MVVWDDLQYHILDQKIRSSIIMEAPENFSPSFDKDIHIKTIDPTPDHVTIIESVRNTISSSDHYDEMWCTDNEIMRFLIARNFKHNETCALLEEALEWRNTRKAHLLETKEDWQSFLHREHSTGKLVVQGVNSNKVYI